MHRLAVAVALALITALVAAAGAAAGDKPRKCGEPGRGTVVANERLHVYIRGDGRLIGCSYKTGRRFRLPVAEPGVDGYGPWALAGRFVAFRHTGACGLCVDENSFVYVFDSVSRRERSWRLDFYDDGVVAAVTDIDVNRQGRVAWIFRNRRAPEDIQVQTESATDTPTVLDSGPDIARNSLAISGSTLYWTKAGAPQSAELSAP
jgi:hypothetical protein